MTLDEFKSFVDKIPAIPDDQKIYYVHTERGEYYEYFIEGKYIAIGQNEISTEEVVLASSGFQDPARAVLMQLAVDKAAEEGRPFDPNSRKAKTLVSRHLKSQLAFHDLKENDIVCIPGPNSRYLAFGVVVSSDYLTGDDIVPDGCLYTKRKRIEWANTDVPLKSLHPKFIDLRHTRHAVTDVPVELWDIIRKTVYPLYTVHDNTYLTLHVERTGPIHPMEVVYLLNASVEALHRLNALLGYGEDLADIALKINVESPGTSSFIQKQKKKTLMAFGALMLFATQCGQQYKSANPNATKQQVEQAVIQELPEDLAPLYEHVKPALDSASARTHGKIILD